MSTTLVKPAADACACPDFSLGRRRFLAATAAATGAVAGAQLFGDAYRQVAYGATTGNNVIVVLSMRGGADGLSMVVPRGADWTTLAAARPNIVVPQGSLIGGDSAFGLHPQFAPLLPMWQAGTFGAVHAVGLPAPNRSHFDAMLEIEDAAVGDSLRTGWLNRTVGLNSASLPEEAMQMGSVLLPTSLAGPAPAIGADNVAGISLASLGTTDAQRRTSVNTLWANDSAVAGNSVRDAVGVTQRLSGLATAAAATGSTTLNKTLYTDPGPLVDVLSNTAALIKADLGARLVTVDYGNWDMHMNLGGLTSTGWMVSQVRHLATSLAAFFSDLGTAASRVTVVTMSEFGRRVQQNGSGGLDHGYANAMLVLGAGVNGGAVRGQWPGLSALNSGDLDMRQNFQTVLWEVLTKRFPDLTGQRTSIFPDLTPSGATALGTMR